MLSQFQVCPSGGEEGGGPVGPVHTGGAPVGGLTGTQAHTLLLLFHCHNSPEGRTVLGGADIGEGHGSSGLVSTQEQVYASQTHALPGSAVLGG